MKMPSFVSLLLAAALAALVSGCGAERQESALPPPSLEIGEPPNDPMWRLEITPAGAFLSIPADASGSHLLRLGCEGEPAMLTLVADTIETIASEERFSFGVDGEPYIFVADATRAPGSGVRAERPIGEDLLSPLEHAQELGAVYGAAYLGPFPAPEQAELAEFVASCRSFAQR